jgi:hypothetical protein
VGLAGGNDCIEDTTGLDNTANILCSQTDKAMMTGLFAVPLGMLIGAMAAPGEQWRPESPPPVAVGVGLAPGGGVCVQVALRF